MQERGCCIDEWCFPTGTLWGEHKHLAGFDAQYTSKIEAFRALVDRAKLSALPLSAASGHREGTERPPGGQEAPPTSWELATQRRRAELGTSQAGSTSRVVDLASGSNGASQSATLTRPQRITLVADFPHLPGPDAREALCDLLVQLAQTAASPVVVLVTESGVLSQSQCPVWSATVSELRRRCSRAPDCRLCSAYPLLQLTIRRECREGWRTR